MRKDVSCATVCSKKFTPKEADTLSWYIQLGYHYNFLLDDLPAAVMPFSYSGDVVRQYAGGLPIGFWDNDLQQFYVYNHLQFVIYYYINEEPKVTIAGTNGKNDSNDDKTRHSIVSFAVWPMSVAQRSSDDKSKSSTCPSGGPLRLESFARNQIIQSNMTVVYTYDVVWKRSGVQWSSRWDVYLSEDHFYSSKACWYSIFNSCFVMLVMLAVIDFRVLRDARRDVAAYEASLDDNKDNTEATISPPKNPSVWTNSHAWILLHGDVFRPPSTMPVLFAVLVGTGAQLFVAVFCAIALACCGFVSPTRPGSILVGGLGCYVLSGPVAGFVANSLNRIFSDTDDSNSSWWSCTIMTATLFPTIVLTITVPLNAMVASVEDAVAIPIMDIVAVVLIWSCVSIPMVFAGAIVASRTKKLSFPTATSDLIREIPSVPWYACMPMSVLMGGILPFCSPFFKFFSILTAMWMDQHYSVFRFAMLSYLITCMSAGLVTTILVSVQLSFENHRWWWFSFFAAGGTGGYAFVYSVYWFNSYLHASLDTPLVYGLYFGYMFLVSLAVMLITGAIGVLAGLWLTRKIYRKMVGLS